MLSSRPPALSDLADEIGTLIHRPTSLEDMEFRGYFADAARALQLTLLDLSEFTHHPNRDPHRGKRQ